MLYGMAGVVELADTLALGASARKSVGVQLSLPAPERKLQARGLRLASLGGQFVLNFRGKNELAIF